MVCLPFEKPNSGDAVFQGQYLFQQTCVAPPLSHVTGRSGWEIELTVALWSPKPVDLKKDGLLYLKHIHYKTFYHFALVQHFP